MATTFLQAECETLGGLKNVNCRFGQHPLSPFSRGGNILLRVSCKWEIDCRR